MSGSIKKGEWSNLTCFVTGGTGFIGRKLVSRLLEKGARVRLLIRKTSDLTGLDNERLSFHEGSLLDAEFLKRAMEGCDFVFHLASYANSWSKDESIYFSINVEGTKTMASSAVKAGVKRFLHCSSIVTFGATGSINVENETHNPKNRCYYTTYEETKALAEPVVLDFVAKGLEVVIVNPTRVYGPGLISESNSVTLMVKNYLKWRNYLLLGTGKEQANYVFVDDVVEGMILAVERGRTGECYILGGENSSLKSFFRTVAKISGKKAIPVYVPPFVAMFVAVLQELKAKIFGSYPLITRPWVRTFLQDWLYSSAKAERELNYKPLALEEGLHRTIEWLKGYPV